MLGIDFKMLTLEGTFVCHEGVERLRIVLSNDNPNNEWLIVSSKKIDSKEFSSSINPPHLLFNEHQLFFPHFTDLHVHAREDSSGNENYKEDFQSASKAAMNGGVYAFMEMPNNRGDPPINLESYKRKLALTLQSYKNNFVKIIPYALLTPLAKNYSTLIPFDLPFKIYYGLSVGQSTLGIEKHHNLKEILSKFEGKYISFHAEHPTILYKNRNEINHEDKRPVEAEVSAISDILNLTAKYNLKSTICHLSTKDGARLCVEAKKSGLNIAMELSFHHLFYSKEWLDTLEMEERKYFKVNPPIRSEENRRELIEILKSGQVDFIASDHAPHSREEKLLSSGMPGITHLDTFSIGIGKLLKDFKIPPHILYQTSVENPSLKFNNFWNKISKLPWLSENKSEELKSLFYLDHNILNSKAEFFTLIDLQKEMNLKDWKFETKCGLHPYFKNLELSFSVKSLKNIITSYIENNSQRRNNEQS